MWQIPTEVKDAITLPGVHNENNAIAAIAAVSCLLNISSDEYSQRLTKSFETGRDVVILIGGAYGFDAVVREKSDFVWSFSKLVFPHMLARVVVAEQTYRAQEIYLGKPYHHE